MDISVGWNNESEFRLTMNRTLRRPMFRMGGSAEGLTSGLQDRGIKEQAKHGNNLLKKFLTLEQKQKKQLTNQEERMSMIS